VTALPPSYPDALVVMVKPPRPGLVKTRLQPSLSPKECAALYRCFLVDIERELRGWDHPCDRWWAWGSDDDEELPPELAELLPDDARLVRQEGQGLTERMKAVFRRLFDLGYQRVVMRNSDSPHLPLTELKAAFRGLDAPNSVVLGPDLGGGYYLIGADAPLDGLLPERMSTASVYAQTAAAVESAGRRLTELPAFLDVDTPEDLAVFWYEFGGRADVRHWATWQQLQGWDWDERLATLTMRE
jgi:rSAM/selenodomain-associated transferase 1